MQQSFHRFVKSAGVETTRHFLLEWLSYTCRYIPVGLLEVVPQRLNWRPPSYFGRDDLETLMSSDSAADWVTLLQLIVNTHFIARWEIKPSNLNFVPSQFCRLRSQRCCLVKFLMASRSLRNTSPTPMIEPKMANTQNSSP